MIASLLLMATFIITPEPGQHPYNIAQEHCIDHGGLAQYIDTGQKIEFSCADDPSKIIIINYQGVI